MLRLEHEKDQALQAYAEGHGLKVSEVLRQSVDRLITPEDIPREAFDIQEAYADFLTVVWAAQRIPTLQGPRTAAAKRLISTVRRFLDTTPKVRKAKDA